MDNVVRKYEHIDELDKYFKEANQYDKLTKEEEFELGMRIMDGDRDAVNELVKHNLRFVVKIAKGYRALTDVSFADLIAEGNLGLIKAAEKFDVTKDNRFTSYAVWWIRASINECIEKYRGNIEYNFVDDEQMVNISDKDQLYDEINDDFEKKINNIQSRQTAVDDLVKCLEEREKKIIMLFFGLGETKREMNLDEIGQEMNLTTERVRQIKDMALVKLKCEALTSNAYDEYRNLR